MVTDSWYYAFLDRCDLFSDHTKPLEDVRALWEHSSNAEKQYEVWAGLMCSSNLADPNPIFDATVRPPDPRSAMIIWRAGAEGVGPFLLSKKHFCYQNTRILTYSDPYSTHFAKTTVFYRIHQERTRRHKNTSKF